MGGAGRERIPGAAVVEETLRYDPSVQLMGRITADDMTIGETTVVKGDTTMLPLGPAGSRRRAVGCHGRSPHARIDGDPEYEQNLALRGMSALPVAL